MMQIKMQIKLKLFFLQKASQCMVCFLALAFVKMLS